MVIGHTHKSWDCSLNTAFNPFVQNAAEPQVRKATNSRAIWSLSNQGAGAFWTQGGKVGIWKQSHNNKKDGSLPKIDKGYEPHYCLP
jgi:hypothetical protein